MQKAGIVIVILLILSALSPLAQRQPAGIGGYVYFNGSPVAGAYVTVVNENTGENVTATTNSDGLYSASLYAEDGDIIRATAVYNRYSASNSIVANLSKVTQWINISITTGGGGGGIKADFSYYPKKPYVGDTVSFIDKSTGNIISWRWDFGDGTTSTQQNPTHVYNKSKFYEVSLTVRGTQGTDTVTKSIYVWKKEEEEEGGNVVIPPPPPPEYPENPYTIPEMYKIIGLDNQQGLNGDIKVAVIDTGVLKQVYNGNNYTINLNDVIAHSITKYPVYDENGHGTFVNAEVAYAMQKWNIGKQYSIRVMDKNGVCSVMDLQQAFKIAENLGCNVISLSLGGMGKVGDAMDKMVREAVNHGIVVVAAAGNYGPEPYTITSPALSPYAIAVGAEDPTHTLNTVFDDRVTEWSSRGPVIGLSELKPDVVGGGESIIGPYLDEEKVLSGTSMATPIIAGGVAYMIGANRNLMNIMDMLWFWDKSVNEKIVEKSLEKSCRKIIGDKNAQGNGIPYIPDATKYLHDEIVWRIILALILYITIVACIGIGIYEARKRKERKRRK